MKPSDPKGRFYMQDGRFSFFKESYGILSVMFGVEEQTEQLDEDGQRSDVLTTNSNHQSVSPVRSCLQSQDLRKEKELCCLVVCNIN